MHCEVSVHSRMKMRGFEGGGDNESDDVGGGGSESFTFAVSKSGTPALIVANCLMVISAASGPNIFLLQSPASQLAVIVMLCHSTTVAITTAVLEKRQASNNICRTHIQKFTTHAHTIC